MPLKLELAPMKKPSQRNPITSRRQSLLKSIDRQLIIVDSLLANGEIPQTENGRRLSPWFWIDETGKYYLSINYGKKPIELAKGKHSIVCADIKGIKDALLIVRDAVQKGEFDSHLQQRSHSIRSNFRKP